MEACTHSLQGDTLGTYAVPGAVVVVAPEVVTDSVVVEAVVQTGFVVEGKMTSYLYSMFHLYPKMFNVCFIQNLLWYA